MSGFRITDNRGFHITFENGVTVSVQFGPGNYCDNYDAPFNREAPAEGWTSTTAETAAWDRNHRWVIENGDEVQARRTPAEVLDFMNRMAKL